MPPNKFRTSFDILPSMRSALRTNLEINNFIRTLNAIKSLKNISKRTHWLKGLQVRKDPIFKLLEKEKGSMLPLTHLTEAPSLILTSQSEAFSQSGGKQRKISLDKNLDPR